MKTFKVWNMTTGEEYEVQSEDIIDFIGETPFYKFEIIDSYYDTVLRKWFHFIRRTEKEYTNARDKNIIQIMQISLK